jgi:hypothetical protein
MPDRTPALDPERRRALELLAGSPEATTEHILAAHGISVSLIVDLIHAGLATARPQRMWVGKREIEVAVVQITEAGRRALDA